MPWRHKEVLDGWRQQGGLTHAAEGLESIAAAYLQWGCHTLSEPSGDFAYHGWIIARTVRFLVFFVVTASVDLPQKPLKHAKTSTFQARDQQNMKCLLLSLGGMIHLDRQVWPATKDQRWDDDLSLTDFNMSDLNWSQLTTKVLYENGWKIGYSVAQNFMVDTVFPYFHSNFFSSIPSFRAQDRWFSLHIYIYNIYIMLILHGWYWP